MISGTQNQLIIQNIKELKKNINFKYNCIFFFFFSRIMEKLMLQSRQ